MPADQMTLARQHDIGFQTISAQFDRPLIRFERVLGKRTASAAMADDEGKSRHGRPVGKRYIMMRQNACITYHLKNTLTNLKCVIVIGYPSSTSRHGDFRLPLPRTRGRGLG